MLQFLYNIYTNYWMSNRLHSCYYLLYKLVKSPLLWIIQVSDDKYELFNRIENFKSTYEQYYIVKRYVTHLEEQFKIKHFNIFQITRYDIILHKTKLPYDQYVTSTKIKTYY